MVSVGKYGSTLKKIRLASSFKTGNLSKISATEVLVVKTEVVRSFRFNSLRRLALKKPLTNAGHVMRQTPPNVTLRIENPNRHTKLKSPTDTPLSKDSSN